MTIPDWQLPPGVDRGLWDYLNSSDMVAVYDEQMRVSALATADVAFCEKSFAVPGKLIDLGCGTGRLCLHFVNKGFDCVGVDLSDEMLAKARANWEAARRPGSVDFVKANLVDLSDLPAGSFDYAACLFSTLGMVHGAENRSKLILNAHRLLKPGGKLVVHAHNRYFRELGLKRIATQAAKSLVGRAGDITMPQAYGGAPLTLHHFSRREVVRLLEDGGFVIREVRPIGVNGQPVWPWWWVYGWMVLGTRAT
jgi:SAM-dependent methyltransferase